MKNKTININYTSFLSFDKIDKKDFNLIKSAEKAMKNAYSPYSNFKVGASVLLEGDIIIEGNNQENAVYPAGICAERVALFFAKAQYPKNKIEAIAIISSSSKGIKKLKVVSPCGICRQTLIEYEFNQKQNIKIIMASVEGKGFIFESAKDLLPFAFDVSNLG